MELRKDSLSFMETLGQSVVNVSPTLTPARWSRASLAPRHGWSM